MYFSKKQLLFSSLSISILFISGCGGSGATPKESVDTSILVNGEIDASENNESSEVNQTKNYPLTYSYTRDIMIEKYGEKNLSWVNATGTACLKYKVKDGISIYDKGVSYCSELVLGGIDTWRLPSEDEAVHFMANVPLNPNADQSRNPNSDPAYLIYPDDGQTCLFMASENSKNFNYVYTTNDVRNGSFNAPSRQTAGIRCVVDNSEEDN